VADQDYRSTFSAVNAARDAETPASDQYAVPATAAGASLQATWGDPAALAGPGATAADAVTTVGFDARHVVGETREHYFFSAGDFTRERRAGGAQTVAGLFASHGRPLAPAVTLDLGARVDSTWLNDGFRRETTRATGAVLLDETYADRDDLAFSPRLGLAWRATRTLTARAAAYSAYRTPTLNELYRPFRVGPVTTLANPDLEPETLLGGEAGLDWTSPDRRRGLRATVFQNELSDAVANVTLDAATRQRRNLDATRIRGLELAGRWEPVPALRLEADYLLSDARVRSGGPGAEDLDGKRLAQVPRHTLSAGAAWRATRVLSLDLRARWFSEQYEDDLNTLALRSATRLDLAAHYGFAPRWRLTLAVENLLDAEIETARTAAGLVSIAPPRLARAELSYTW
jgi:outer membrane receptor protein involved in Fe transport